MARTATTEVGLQTFVVILEEFKDVPTQDTRGIKPKPNLLKLVIFQ